MVYLQRMRATTTVIYCCFSLQKANTSTLFYTQRNNSEKLCKFLFTMNLNTAPSSSPTKQSKVAWYSNVWERIPTSPIIGRVKVSNQVFSRKCVSFSQKYNRNNKILYIAILTRSELGKVSSLRYFQFLEILIRFATGETPATISRLDKKTYLIRTERSQIAGRFRTVMHSKAFTTGESSCKKMKHNDVQKEHVEWDKHRMFRIDRRISVILIALRCACLVLCFSGPMK